MRTASIQPESNPWDAPIRVSPPATQVDSWPVSHKFGRAATGLASLVGLLGVLAANCASGQTLTNGFDQAGTLVLSATNAYTFYATNGDTVILRAGAPFRPLVVLRAPNGVALATASGSGSSSIDAATTPLVLTTNGLFTVQVSSYYGNGTGAISLSLARVPGAFEVAPADEGGSMVNGGAYPGTNSLGDIDMWSFTATAGERIMVRVGTTGFRPYLLLYAPNGAQLAVGAGNGSGDTDGLVDATAPSNGTYTAVLESYYANGSGPYTIHLAKSTGAFVVSPGDEGGDLINGAANTGQITKGDLDLWRFDASVGDNISIRIGSPAFRPWLRLYGPTGVLFREGLAATSADNDTLISGRATNTGTFLVVAQSYYDSLSSPYTLHLAKMPGSYVVSPGDEGGTLTNGLATLATNALGDLDVWTFTATAGDNIALRIGAPDYRPWIQLYGPTGVLIQEAFSSASAHRDAAIFVQATNSGMFTVVQQSYYLDGIGPYTLSLGRFPGAYFVSPGDEGDRLTNGISYDATIALGDLDLWNFAACKGYAFTITCQKLTGTFTPRVRLYGRNGVLLSTAQSATTVTINYPGTNSGNYSLLIDGAGVNDSGTYRLTAYGIYEDALQLCPPLVTGSNLELTGHGGNAGTAFVLLTTTDVTTPSALWTPVLTNQFDGFGGFDHTNLFHAGEAARFFRVRTD
ncbi:MAG: hypothetical protein KBH45_02690 [Verrucomicrobia bacterium]|nr:hypothetical protein [Verrucomicrobiota bacterium]